MITLWHTHRWVVASDAEAAQKLADEKFPGKVAKLSQARSSPILNADDQTQIANSSAHDGFFVQEHCTIPVLYASCAMTPYAFLPSRI